MWDHNYSKRSEWSKTKPINIYSYCSIKGHICVCYLSLLSVLLSVFP